MYKRREGETIGDVYTQPFKRTTACSYPSQVTVLCILMWFRDWYGSYSTPAVAPAVAGVTKPACLCFRHSWYPWPATGTANLVLSDGGLKVCLVSLCQCQTYFSKMLPVKVPVLKMIRGNKMDELEGHELEEFQIEGIAKVRMRETEIKGNA